MSSLEIPTRKLETQAAQYSGLLSAGARGKHGFRVDAGPRVSAHYNKHPAMEADRKPMMRRLLLGCCAVICLTGGAETLRAWLEQCIRAVAHAGGPKTRLQAWAVGPDSASYFVEYSAADSLTSRSAYFASRDR